ncbi:hypothetical protein [Paracoccus benzoatiresistens]|uniref:HTH cro/C1-type domain-containing protein n=1 Tax=Paracoccus benzoatiresistens TaxID=2997341 RepID=A0ABT4J6W7_9RHOB|nr:hypothetical protein [Paracoccus sp. EF6]MCZ0962860.1 hypothetical protein [Paracoccus sp. EF6]
METIDAKWIIDRLTGKRGEKSALAKAMGVSAAEVSKILKGERRVQPEEMAKVKAFFDGPDAPARPAEKRLADRLKLLTDEELDLMSGAVDGLIARRREGG